MSSFWWIQLFWLALALPGYAALRRWDPTSLNPRKHGALFRLGRSYLASLLVLTPFSVLGYILNWPLRMLSAVYVCGVVCGAIVLAADLKSQLERRTPSVVAAIGGIALCVDIGLGVRAGTHLQGDAGYHIARVRSLVELGLNNWDPVVSAPRFDVIYHTNLYHALIAVSAQLTQCDAAQAWLATWPFAKLLTACAAFQLASTVFRSQQCGWLASLATLAAHSAYAVLPFPNTLAPLALLPMGLCAAVALLAGDYRRSQVLWLAASAVALAQVHMLNAVFLALIVSPCLLVAIPLRGRKPKALLWLGVLACGASVPWLIVAGLPRLEAMLATAPAFQGEPTRPTDSAEPPAPRSPEEPATEKKVYKQEHFRKLDSGLSVYEPSQLLGGTNLLAPALLAITLAFARWRRGVVAWLGLVATTYAWLLIPALCALLLRVTSAPWAAERITQVFGVAWLTSIVAAPWAWGERLRPRGWPRRILQLSAACAALLTGLMLNSHAEPWSLATHLTHAREGAVLSEWGTLRARQQLLCDHIPAGEQIMAHPRWDYGLPMLCRTYTLALSPGRGWHGLAFMAERRADIDEFFREDTSGERRLALMAKYNTQHVYTTNRLARRIVASLPQQSRVIASARQGAVVFVDL